MSVPQFLDGSGTTYAYNQLYRVRADVTESPREYDFSDIEDYDASKNPGYIKLGDTASQLASIFPSVVPSASLESVNKLLVLLGNGRQRLHVKQACR